MNLKQGETARFDCDNCSTEFEVTLEPKAKGKPPVRSDPKEVVHCPFCGSERITSEEEG